jgi:hypothetical protein
MLDWIRSHQTTIWWLAGASSVTFIAALIFVPFLVARIPVDYFVYARRRKKRPPEQRSLPVRVLRIVFLIVKNLVGFVFVLTGILMLVLPGQGMLTILIGIMLLNFPGKYRAQRWFVSRRPVLRSINRLRRRAGRPPLLLEM